MSVHRLVARLTGTVIDLAMMVWSNLKTSHINCDEAEELADTVSQLHRVLLVAVEQRGGLSEDDPVLRDTLVDVHDKLCGILNLVDEVDRKRNSLLQRIAFSKDMSDRIKSVNLGLQTRLQTLSLYVTLHTSAQDVARHQQLLAELAELKLRLGGPPGAAGAAHSISVPPRHQASHSEQPARQRPQAHSFCGASPSAPMYACPQLSQHQHPQQLFGSPQAAPPSQPAHRPPAAPPHNHQNYRNRHNHQDTSSAPQAGYQPPAPATGRFGMLAHTDPPLLPRPPLAMQRPSPSSAVPTAHAHASLHAHAHAHASGRYPGLGAASGGASDGWLSQMPTPPPVPDAFPRVPFSLPSDPPQRSILPSFRRPRSADGPHDYPSVRPA